MRRPLYLLLCTLAFAVVISGIYGIDIQFQAASAQPSSNDTSNSQSVEVVAQVPGWVKNNTALWADGKLDDSQFILGMRYLVANDIMGISPQYLDSGLQKPVPSWVKDIALWWTSGSITDYEFVSDMQYLVVNGDLSIGAGDNQTAIQDSYTLQNNFAKGKIKIDNTTLDVQIADTPDKMTEGLQFQQPLPYSQGMIFVFPQPQVVAMWMKDMQFPLDMIWFDSNGNIIHIEKNLAVCTDSQPCPVYDAGGQNTKYVLEVTAGFVDRFNVTAKSKLVILDSL